MAFLLVSDLGVAIGRPVAQNNRHFMLPRSHRGAQALGTKVDAVASFAVRGDARQAVAGCHAVGCPWQVLRVRPRGTRYAGCSGLRTGGLLAPAVAGRRLCSTCRRRTVSHATLRAHLQSRSNDRRLPAHTPGSRRQSHCIVQQDELNGLRLVPWHAHETIVPLPIDAR